MNIAAESLQYDMNIDMLQFYGFLGQSTLNIAMMAVYY